MVSGGDRDSDRFEAQLAQQRARQRGVIRLLGLLLMIGGLGAGGYALFAVLTERAHFALLLVCAALALIGLGSGAVVLLRSRQGVDEEGEAFDDFLARRAPRILGGQDPDSLDVHHRRRRR